MSGVRSHVKEDSMPRNSEDGNSEASHSQSIFMSAIKEEPDSDLHIETETIRAEFGGNGTSANDVLVKQEAREVVDHFVFIKVEPESCSRFLPELTADDRVQVKEGWIEDVKLELGSSVDIPTCNFDPLCGPSIKIESCLAGTDTGGSSMVDAKDDQRPKTRTKDFPSLSRMTVLGMSRCRTDGLLKEEQDIVQGKCDEEQSFSCHTCSKSFKWKRCLIDHMCQHNGERRPHVCTICQSRFRHASLLKAHKRTHTGEKPYQCDVCESRFREAGHLKKHKRIHTGEKPFLCDVCESRFRNAGNFKRHKRTHTGEKLFVCEVCESRFYEADHLKRHKRVHTGEKPYLCDVCECRFRNAGNLKSHKRIHTGEKPFVCNVCESRFSRTGNLKRHMRTHTGVKPFVCDVCESRFNQAGSLKNHMRTHTGEKPYLCDVCESRFREAGHLKKHKKIHSE